MKVLASRPLIAGCLASLILPFSDPLFSQEAGPSAERIANMYQQILAGADQNADGMLSVEECVSISRNKSKIEKDCRYWDANSDGFIAEEEYVGQVKAIMR